MKKLTLFLLFVSILEISCKRSYISNFLAPSNDTESIDPFNIAHLICKGKVISKKETSISEVLPNLGKTALKVELCEIQIRKLYKGKTSKENIHVYSLAGEVRNPQQFPFKIGHEYLIFAIKDEYILHENGEKKNGYILHPYKSTKEIAQLKNEEISKLEMLIKK